MLPVSKYYCHNFLLDYVTNMGKTGIILKIKNILIFLKICLDV